LLGTVALAAPGCIQSRATTSRSVEPLAEGSRSGITSVGIRMTAGQDSQHVVEPWRRSDAAGKGAGAGALYTIGAGLQGAPETYGLSVLLGIVLAPAGAVIGAVTGLAGSTSDAVVNEQRDRFIDALKMVHLERELPMRLSTLVQAEARVRASTSAADQAGAVLEMTIEAYGLRGTTMVADPDLRAFVRVRGRLVESGSGRLIHQLVWDHEGEPRRFKEWAGAGTEEIVREYRRLGSDIAQAASDEMFRLAVIP